MKTIMFEKSEQTFISTIVDQRSFQTKKIAKIKSYMSMKPKMCGFQQHENSNYVAYCIFNKKINKNYYVRRHYVYALKK